ncbi:TetR/AcrR family transcriptional regulator [Sphingomonas populi]|uniref:TetR/AcrR family transcriptional regulator n=1 Tax=Sphingomonas populi TaxID=2484750 RepID=A0A4Q6XZB1_9SPHN|nr:TetR/AcrR family transcriptional regulator [Sphingomonas populi]RZF66233.1 TetR/AcrR family transcriptional regulator [Sphingomonas populi]
MPRRTKTAEPMLIPESVSRQPQQGRSKASLGRMLGAAEKLMLERGNEDFTLQEVSKAGKVSIGSIYLRFESKDNLVRAVIGNELERIAVDEATMMADVVAGSPDLAAFMPRYVEAYAEVLRQHAPLLRLSMQRASFDPLVSEPGKQRAFRSEEAAVAAMLSYRAEFCGNRHEQKAKAAFNIIFATLARQLSLGSTGESASLRDWAELKAELGRMCLTYLKQAE